MKAECSVEGCTGLVKGRGWCKLHYDRWLRRRTLDLYDPVEEEHRRFWEKVRVSPHCWLWESGKDKHGYGQFSDYRRRSVWAHRRAYELLIGPIPAGMALHHLCMVPACVNPAHLRPMSNAEHRQLEHTQTKAERNALALYKMFARPHLLPHPASSSRPRGPRTTPQEGISADQSGKNE